MAAKLKEDCRSKLSNPAKCPKHASLNARPRRQGSVDVAMLPHAHDEDMEEDEEEEEVSLICISNPFASWTG